MRRHLPLTGIVLLAAILRLGGLGSRSLWLDEGAEYDAVHGSLGHLFERVVNRESTPPLSYLYEWASTKVIGTSEFALRLPFALLGIALVPVMYLAARELAGRRAGLIAAALAGNESLATKGPVPLVAPCNKGDRPLSCIVRKRGLARLLHRATGGTGP